MSIRNLISKFLTQLCEKNYSEANKSLNQIVENKTKAVVKAIRKVDSSEKPKAPYARPVMKKKATVKAVKKLPKDSKSSKDSSKPKNENKPKLRSDDTVREYNGIKEWEKRMEDYKKNR